MDQVTFYYHKDSVAGVLYVRHPQWRRSRGGGGGEEMGGYIPPIFDQGGMAYVIIPPQCYAYLIDGRHAMQAFQVLFTPEKQDH